MPGLLSFPPPHSPPKDKDTDLLIPSRTSPPDAPFPLNYGSIQEGEGPLSHDNPLRRPPPPEQKSIFSFCIDSLSHTANTCVSALKNTANRLSSSCGNEQGWDVFLSYCASLKGAIGGMTLVEVIIGLTNYDLDDSQHVWPIAIPAEIILALSALFLNRPFYLENLREGRVAMGLATPVTPAEHRLREEMQSLNIWQSIATYGLALGFGIGQAGMPLTTHFMSELFPNSYVWLGLFALPLLTSNLIIGVPKAKKACSYLKEHFGHAPTLSSLFSRQGLVTGVLTLSSALAVLPNILSSGRVLNFLTPSSMPLLERLFIILGTGSLMSISPFGINIQEGEKLLLLFLSLNNQTLLNTSVSAPALTNINTENSTSERTSLLVSSANAPVLPTPLNANLSFTTTSPPASRCAQTLGYLGALFSALMSSIFTYALLLKVLENSEDNNIIASTDDPAALGLAIAFTLFTILFLTLTKGGAFVRHYQGRDCTTFLNATFCGGTSAHQQNNPHILSPSLHTPGLEKPSPDEESTGMSSTSPERRRAPSGTEPGPLGFSSRLSLTNASSANENNIAPSIPKAP